MGAEIIVLIAIVAFAAAGVVVAVALAIQRRWSWTAEERFSSEDDHPIDDDAIGVPATMPETAAEVARPPERLADLVIRPLTRPVHHRLSEEWASVQAVYFDNPELAVEQADGLIEDVLRARGYPMKELEDRAWSRSVQDGGIADQYLAAHAIATATRGAADDPDREAQSLRQAFQLYRALFAELLESRSQFRGDQPMTRISRAS